MKFLGSKKHPQVSVWLPIKTMIFPLFAAHLTGKKFSLISISELWPSELGTISRKFLFHHVQIFLPEFLSNSQNYILPSFHETNLIKWSYFHSSVHTCSVRWGYLFHNKNNLITSPSSWNTELDNVWYTKSWHHLSNYKHALQMLIPFSLSHSFITLYGGIKCHDLWDTFSCQERPTVTRANKFFHAIPSFFILPPLPL